MATGTGKTLTAINCVINEYQITNELKNIIVVPGIELVNQWYQELKVSNFKMLFKWSSSNSKLNEEVNIIKCLKDSNSLNIIITYDSFISDKFLNIFSNELHKYIVVFDEVHEIASIKRKKIISELKFKKLIGLSATPLRLWDENQENLFIEKLFHSSHPYYTFNYTMEKAINNGFLCQYNYRPYFAYLNEIEFNEYIKLTSKIPLGKDKINSHAAIKRQLVLDSALDKQDVFIDILTKMVENDNYKYTLVYCPKGKDNEESRLNNLRMLASERFPKINTLPFLGISSRRATRLKQFENGFTDMLFAIKCLDQGVNIPRTENAIFLASGKNYREFIQRRGRVLRNYKDNEYTKMHSNIYDIIVLPTISQFYNQRSIMTKLIYSEFRRFVEFNKLAIFSSSTYRKVQKTLEEYGLTYEFINTQIKKD